MALRHSFLLIFNFFSFGFFFEQPATLRGVIIPDNHEAKLAQLQQSLNLFRRGLQLISEALDIMGQISPPEPDP